MNNLLVFLWVENTKSSLCFSVPCIQGKSHVNYQQNNGKEMWKVLNKVECAVFCLIIRDNASFLRRLKTKAHFIKLIMRRQYNRNETRLDIHELLNFYRNNLIFLKGSR